MEAANDALSKATDGTMPREWVGVDSNGVTWRGYYQDGRIVFFIQKTRCLKGELF